MSVNHSYSDQVSSIILMNELLRLLNKEQLENYPLASLTHENYKIPTEPAMLSRDNIMKFEFKRQEPSQQVNLSVVVKIEKADFQKILKSIKQKQIGLQALLWTANALAWLRHVEHDGGDVVFQCPINRRNCIGVGQCVGLLVEPMFIRIGLTEFDTPIAAAQLLSKLIKEEFRLNKEQYAEFRYQTFHEQKMQALTPSIFSSSTGASCRIEERIDVSDTAFLGSFVYPAEIKKDSMVMFGMHAYEVQGNLMCNWTVSPNADEKQRIAVLDEFAKAIKEISE